NSFDICSRGSQNAAFLNTGVSTTASAAGDASTNRQTDGDLHFRRSNLFSCAVCKGQSRWINPFDPGIRRQVGAVQKSAFLDAPTVLWRRKVCCQKKEHRRKYSRVPACNVSGTHLQKGQ